MEVGNNMDRDCEAAPLTHEPPLQSRCRSINNAATNHRPP